MKIKFSVIRGVGEALADALQTRKCYVEAIKKGKKRGMEEPPETKDSNKRGKNPVPGPEPDKETSATVQPVEELLTIKLTPGDPGKITKIESKMSESIQNQMINYLQKNKDIFAWTPQDLEEIDPSDITHHLNLDPGVKAEIQFPEWFSNVVLVPKLGGKWRMCIDFRNLSKACPKDFYPVPRIDQLVDFTSGCKLLSMMDALQGYHQIMLSPEDHKRVSFITSDEMFCYVAMPFGLKNAGATYQRLVDKIFQPQLGRNMEVYVDDILVKSKEATQPYGGFRSNLRDTKKIQIKTQPQKMRIRGALSRFVSKSAEKGLPFFKTLRKVKNFKWIEECQQAFEELKEYLARLPLLVKPILGDTLYLYLPSTSQAISSVLVREENDDQTPIYYISKVLNGAECRYPPIEKMALALVTTALADFISEMIGTTQDEVPEERPWLLYVDRSSTAQGSGAGVNTGASHLLAYSDSQLIVKQVDGEYEAKEDSMAQYFRQIEELKTKFRSFRLQQIPREENIKADYVSKLASALEGCKTRRITVKHLSQPRASLNI
ncbi:UNVERIFIED_CONTAM: Retrovirus-related Pol polyprotein from transposon.6 [Sesamum calycinum]|uniref:Retrovirus-related Pol polyprotein from transposon.6 n=1 Tax=Sesamum calycinum TaxID=2727403 RepID=A0AAW2KN75_9LAMI